MSRLQHFVQQRTSRWTQVELMLSTGLVGIATAVAVLGLTGPVHADRVVVAGNARILDRSESAWENGRLRLIVTQGNGLRVPMDGLLKPQPVKHITGYDYRAGVRPKQQLCGSERPQEENVESDLQATSSAWALTCF